MIHYQDVIELGFKRENQTDPVFFKENGYEWFTVILELKKNKIYFDWESETKVVCMVRTDNSGVKNRRYISNLETLKNIVGFFTESDPVGEKTLDSSTKEIIKYNIVG